MPADVLGQRVHDDVGAPLERLDEAGGGDGVVHDHGDAVAVGRLGDGLDVGDVAGRVADGLEVDRNGLVVDERLEVLGAVAGGEPDVDAEVGQHVLEEGEGAAVQLRDGDHVVAGLGDGEDRVGDRGATGAGRERRDATLEGGQALLEDRLRRVHDPGVDVARDGEVEQVGAVLGVVELVGHRLVDRHRHGLGGGFGLVTGVDGEGFVAHVRFS